MKLKKRKYDEFWEKMKELKTKKYLKKDRPNFKPISKIEKEILLTF